MSDSKLSLEQTMAHKTDNVHIDVESFRAHQLELRIKLTTDSHTPIGTAVGADMYIPQLR